MFAEKFGFVFKNSISFPFSKWSDIRALYLKTALVGSIFLAVLFAITYRWQMLVEAKTRPDVILQSFGPWWISAAIFSVFMLIFVFLPLMVGTLRAAALDEKPDSSVLGAMFAGRQLKFLWAYIKIILVALALFLVIFIPLALVDSFVFTEWSSHGASPDSLLVTKHASFLLILSSALASIAPIIVIIRLMMVPVSAALDKKSNLGDSWKMTKGNWWLIVLTYMAVGIIVNIIVQMLTMFITFLPMVIAYGFFGIDMATPPALLLLGIGYVTGWISIFAQMPTLAVMGNLYRVLSKDNMAEPTELPQLADNS
jgi:hypothetical protein